MIAEWIERLADTELMGHAIVQQYVNSSLDYFNALKSFPDTRKIEQILLEHGININDELQQRLSQSKPLKTIKPSKVIHIVGAPRSGTSFLYYLLAYTGKFAYFTSESHELWGTYNFEKTKKHSIEAQDSHILNVDTKELRLKHDLIIPSEAEHIWHKSIPCYTHKGGHAYELETAQLLDQKGLKENIEEHCGYFQRPRFISKSPFNTLRMGSLEEVYSTQTRFIHIHRDANDCAASIERNKFKYKLPSTNYLTPVESRDWFYNQANNYGNKKILSIDYGDLINNKIEALEIILKWIDQNN